MKKKNPFVFGEYVGICSLILRNRPTQQIMDQSVIGSVKFTGENWTAWKFQTQIILKSKGYYEIVSGVKPKPEATSS